LIDGHGISEGVTLAQASELVERAANNDPAHDNLLAPMTDKTNSRERLNDRIRWDDLLSDEDKEPLSIECSQHPDANNGMTIWRQYDVDSCIIQLRNICALEFTFDLGYIPAFETSLTQNLHCDFSGAQVQKVQNVRLGRYTCDTQAYVHVLFPNLPVNNANTSHLSDEVAAEFVDNCIMPALDIHLPSQTRQQHPRDHDHALAKAMIPNPNGEGRRTGRRAQFEFAIPPQSTQGFWLEVQKRCNLDEHGRDSGSGKFGKPILLLQAHGTKDRFVGFPPSAAIERFSAEFDSLLQQEHVVQEGYWIDLGYRDVPCAKHPTAASSGHTPRPEATLMYKPWCLRDIRDGDDSHLFTGFVKREYTAHGMKDAGSFELVRDPRPNVATGVCQIKSYNSHKEQIYRLDKTTSSFSHPRFASLCLGPALRQARQMRLYGMHGQAASTMHDDEQAFDAQKMRYFNCLNTTTDGRKAGSYGTRTEVRVRFPIVAQIDIDRYLGESLCTQYRQACPDSPDGHDRFYALSTKDVNRFMLANTRRFTMAIERLSVFAQPLAAGGHTFSATEQSDHMSTNAILHRLLDISTSSSMPATTTWLWKKKVPQRPGTGSTGHGFNLEAIFNRLGALWLPHDLFDWQYPALTQTGLQRVHIPTLTNPSSRRAPLPAGLSDSSVNAKINDMLQTTLDGLVALEQEGYIPEANRRLNKAFTLALEFTAQIYHRHFIMAHASYIAHLTGTRQSQAEELCRRLAGSEEYARQFCRPLSLVDVYRLYELVIDEIGLERSITMLQSPCGGLTLPTPHVAKCRPPRKNQSTSDQCGAGTRSWSAHVADHLSAHDGAFQHNGHPYVRFYNHVEATWNQFAAANPESIFVKRVPGSAWKRFCTEFAGSYIFVTFQSDKSKHINTTPSRKDRFKQPRPDQNKNMYNLFKISYSCPSTRTPDSHPPTARLAKELSDTHFKFDADVQNFNDVALMALTISRWPDDTDTTLELARASLQPQGTAGKLSARYSPNDLERVLAASATRSGVDLAAHYARTLAALYTSPPGNPDPPNETKWPDPDKRETQQATRDAIAEDQLDIIATRGPRPADIEYTSDSDDAIDHHVDPDDPL
jgi:hypothetical protein